MTVKWYQECVNVCVVFKGTGCVNELLDCVLSYKGEPKKVYNKIVEHNSYLIAHKGSGFDTYVVLNFFNLNGKVLLVWLKTEQLVYL